LLSDIERLTDRDLPCSIQTISDRIQTVIAVFTVDENLAKDVASSFIDFYALDIQPLHSQCLNLVQEVEAWDGNMMLSKKRDCTRHPMPEKVDYLSVSSQGSESDSRGRTRKLIDKVANSRPMRSLSRRGRPQSTDIARSVVAVAALTGLAGAGGVQPSVNTLSLPPISQPLSTSSEIDIVKQVISDLKTSSEELDNLIHQMKLIAKLWAIIKADMRLLWKKIGTQDQLKMKSTDFVRNCKPLQSKFYKYLEYYTTEALVDYSLILPAPVPDPSD